MEPTFQRSRYQQLHVWQLAMDIVDAVYRITTTFPKDERFGLTQQLRRAAISVPSNIAEGYGRSHRGDYLHHLSIANGSLYEIETQLQIAHRRQYITTEDLATIFELSTRVGQMLAKLKQSLQRPAQ
jgi:four helix bundle protein